MDAKNQFTWNTVTHDNGSNMGTINRKAERFGWQQNMRLELPYDRKIEIMGGVVHIHYSIFRFREFHLPPLKT